MMRTTMPSSGRWAALPGLFVLLAAAGCSKDDSIAADVARAEREKEVSATPITEAEPSDLILSTAVSHF